MRASFPFQQTIPAFIPATRSLSPQDSTQPLPTLPRLKLKNPERTFKRHNANTPPPSKAFGRLPPWLPWGPVAARPRLCEPRTRPPLTFSKSNCLASWRKQQRYSTEQPITDHRLALGTQRRRQTRLLFRRRLLVARPDRPKRALHPARWPHQYEQLCRTPSRHGSVERNRRHHGLSLHPDRR